MKTKVWVLASKAEDDVCVYGSEEEALETFEVAMIVEWQAHAPSSEKDNFPDGDPWQAHAIMADAVEGWPKWRVIPVEVDVPIPQAFRDLLALAQGLDEFRDDYRMNAVLRACEAIVGGAEPSPAPARSGAEPDLRGPLQRLAEKTRRANAIQHSGGRVRANDWAELHQLTNEAFGALSVAREDESFYGEGRANG